MGHRDTETSITNSAGSAQTRRQCSTQDALRTLARLVVLCPAALLASFLPAGPGAGHAAALTPCPRQCAASPTIINTGDAQCRLIYQHHWICAAFSNMADLMLFCGRRFVVVR